MILLKGGCEFFFKQQKEALYVRELQRVKKVYPSLKPEDGERNPMKYRISKKICGNIQRHVDAFELGKPPYKFHSSFPSETAY